MSVFVSHPPVLGPRKSRPSSSSEEPHLSCDPIWMLSTCEMQTIIPLALRGAAPAHLIPAHTSRTAAPDTSVFFSQPLRLDLGRVPLEVWQCSERGGEEVGTSWGSVALSWLTKLRQKGPSLAETDGPAHTHLDGQGNHKKAWSASKPLCHLGSSLGIKGCVCVCVCVCVCE